MLLLLLVWATAATANCPPSTDGPPELIFDQSHEQVAGPFDVSFDGFGRATALLRSRGVLVSQNWQPLPHLLLATRPCGTVLAMTLAMQRSYSEQELEAIDRWVAAGGGLLVLAEADNVFAVGTLQNALLSKHGLSVRPDRLQAAEHYNVSGGMLAETIETTKAREWLWSNSSLLQVGAARVYTAAPICIYPPAKVLLSPLAPLAAALVCPPPVAGKTVGGSRGLLKRSGRGKVAAGGLSRHGRGLIAVLGDQQLFTNMMGGHGIEEGANGLLLLALIAKLCQRALPTATVAEPLQLVNASSQKPENGVVLFATDGGAMPPVGALAHLATHLASHGFSVYSGSVAEASDHKWKELHPAVVVWAVPVIAPAQLTLDRLNNPKLLLVLLGDGYTDSLRTFPYGPLLGSHQGWNRLLQPKFEQYLHDPRVLAGYNTTDLWLWERQDQKLNKGRPKGKGRPIPRNRWGVEPPPQAVVNTGRFDIPLNDLSADGGIFFDALTVLCEPSHGVKCIKPRHHGKATHLEANHFVAPGSWLEEGEPTLKGLVALLRSGTLSVATGLPIKTLMTTGAGTLGATSIGEVLHSLPEPAMQYGLLQAAQRFARTSHRPVVASTKRLFTVADFELVVGEEAQELQSRLVSWINTQLISIQKRAIMEALSQDDEDDDL